MFDILIRNATAITLDKRRQVLPNCGIGIKDGIIADLGPRLRGKGNTIIDAADCAVLPGFVNCHTHVYQALIEGIGYDMHFSPWNLRYLLPVVTNIGPEEARISAELAALEAIKSGTTTVSDHWYLHTDFDNIVEVTRTFSEASLRHHSVYGFLNESFAGRKQRGKRMDMLKPDEHLISRARRYIESWNGKGLTTVALGPGSTEDVSEDLFKRVLALSRESGVAVVTHIAGWIEAVSNAIIKHGMRDLEYAHSLGFTGPHSIAVHSVWLSEDEINILAATNTKVAHNPVANMHLGYGIAPVPAMIAKGITVGLGTDGAASYTYDMLEVAKTAAMLQKVKHLNAEALSAEKTFEMLCLDGAEVLGLEEKVGSIEVGKRADLIVIDLKVPHLLTTAKITPKILYSAQGSDVITSIVDGKLVMKDRELLTLNEKAILDRAERASSRLIEAAGASVRELIAAPWPEKGAAWRLA